MIPFKISLDSNGSKDWTKETFKWSKYNNEIIGLGSL
jgi:hypothetical protein